MGVEYREEPCKAALNRVKGMPFEWSLNPYMGCAHRCTFCYVRAFEKRADRPSDDRYGASIRVLGYPIQGQQLIDDDLSHAQSTSSLSRCYEVPDPLAALQNRDGACMNRTDVLIWPAHAA